MSDPETLSTEQAIAELEELRAFELAGVEAGVDTGKSVCALDMAIAALRSFLPNSVPIKRTPAPEGLCWAASELLEHCTFPVGHAGDHQWHPHRPADEAEREILARLPVREQHENDDGGTRLTEGDGVSVSVHADQLPHDASEKVDLDALQSEAEKLVALLKDRHPGLFTWCEWVHHRIAAIKRLTT